VHTSQQPNQTSPLLIRLRASAGDLAALVEELETEGLEARLSHARGSWLLAVGRRQSDRAAVLRSVLSALDQTVPASVKVLLTVDGRTYFFRPGRSGRPGVGLW
jgi:hypothetical protein